MTALLLVLFCGVDAPLGDQVVEFARSKIGRRVGDGECTSLVVAAFRSSGARRPGFGPLTWGEELKSLRDVRPGDILQFEDAVFVRSRVREDGGFVTLTFTFPHHTAIVARVRKHGPRPILAILHQNAGLSYGEDDRKVVQEWTLVMAEKRRGTVKAYRPVAD